MKISRETVAGLITAVELFVRKDYGRQIKIWEDMAKQICDSLNGRTDVNVYTGYPTEVGIQPATILRVYIKPLNKTAVKLQDDLLTASTPVYTDIKDDEIILNPQCVDPVEIDTLINMLKSCL